MLFLSGETLRVHSADRFRSAGTARCRDFLAQPLVIGGAGVADAIAGERARTDDRWRSRAGWIGRRDRLRGDFPAAFPARMVGRNRGILSWPYYPKVVWYEQSVAMATHPYSAKWWTWPFMLLPYCRSAGFSAQSGNIVSDDLGWW